MKNKKMPLVSIVIPVYNGSNYMKEAIDSALKQTYQNIEIIVINDGSSDEGKTEAIAKSYGNKIRYFAKINGGVSTALNLGINKMRGEYFSWLSHDDIYYPNKISTQIEYLTKYNLLDKNVITYSNYDVIDENSNKTNTVHFELYNPNYYPEFALLRGLISGTALLIPKKAFDEYGLFDEQYRCIQDYLLFFNFMKTYTYIHIPKATNATRVHKNQVTRVNPKVILENNFLWIKMQKDLPDDIKIMLSGSLYKFYLEMYNFLINHNNYLEAHDYSLSNANAHLKEYQLKIDEISKNNSFEYLFCYICKNHFINTPYFYNKKLKECSNIAIDRALQKEVDEIIKNIGINNFVDHIILKLKSPKDVIVYKEYADFKKLIKIKKCHYKKEQRNGIFIKLIRNIKDNGLRFTCQKIIKKFSK